MTLNFDQYGHLTPYEVIPTDLETFKAVFVEGFGESHTRTPIFKAYFDYLNHLRQIVGNGFYQWIDGSFINGLTGVLSRKKQILTTLIW